MTHVLFVGQQKEGIVHEVCVPPAIKSDNDIVWTCVKAQEVRRKRAHRNITEIEKGLSGSKSSGKTDGGTGSRVMGTLLSWMNDKTSEVYIVATSNDVTSLPPELLRKGRFDELFFVDLPNERERAIIFDIHLRKRNRNPENFDIESLVSATEGFTGAEIEQAVIDGMYTAFGSGAEDVETEHISEAISVTSPLSCVNGKQIEQLKSWAKDRCRMASAYAKKLNEKPETNNSGGSRIAV